MKQPTQRTLIRIATIIVVVLPLLALYPPMQVAAGSFLKQLAFINTRMQTSEASGSNLVAAAAVANGPYAFEVLRTFGGDLRARVQVDFETPGVFEAYRQLNSGLLTSLAQSGGTDPVLVTITFWAPLGLSDASQFAQQANVSVLSYGAFGTNAAGQLTSVYVWPEESNMEAFPAVEDFTLDGIMTLTGLISPTSATLESLSSDDRLALIDVTSTQVRQYVETELGAQIDVTQIGVPNPGWSIIAGEITR